MQVIVFEGIDKSGKASCANFTANYLKELGYSVKQDSFHRYDTPTGKIIWDWLHNAYDADQRTIELIMLADKQAQQQTFDRYEQEGVDFLILDRYIASQEVYADYKDSISSIPHRTLHDLIQLGVKEMRQPDITFLNDVEPLSSMNRRGEHGDNDKYESNLSLLTFVRRRYLKYANIYNWSIVDANQPLEECFATIKNELDKRLSLSDAV